ncbi:hypothetical protein GCM10010156_51410 [Planobispora rosea]|uniref:NlpC/P60 domain-containing protein n=1 Tax=Planobispora rosea TaxID=35762 RepID=A0A8J3WG92_PLARO|nr:C40 family peptidase [Planobispora rosea]GGS86589.1 hypothetical protein GCM10010156_51410 [Planobispora rosea]GIH88295.1 hypothetical protein Pro02_67030 [Planobispora rosea]
MSIADVTARIAQLHAFGGAPAVSAAGASGTPATSSASSASATDFAAALEDAKQTTTAGTGATTSTGATGKVTSGSADGKVTGQDVVEQARRYLGVPYLWGGTEPSRGLDCSGLVQLVYKKLGISLPRVSQDQQNEGRSIPSLKQAQPGDLLTFGSPATHIGIYIGDGKMLHAPRTGDVVKIVNMDDYYRKPTDIRRILSDDAASATGATAGQATPAASTPLAAAAQIQSGYGAAALDSNSTPNLTQVLPGAADGLGTGLYDPAQAYVRTIQSAMNGIG